MVIAKRVNRMSNALFPADRAKPPFLSRLHLLLRVGLIFILSQVTREFLCCAAGSSQRTAGPTMLVLLSTTRPAPIQMGPTSFASGSTHVSLSAQTPLDNSCMRVKTELGYSHASIRSRTHC